MCPVTPTAAIKIDETGGLGGQGDRKITVNGKETPYLVQNRWCGICIIADLPVTVVPIGTIPSSGLPCGVAIVAREWQDLQSIEVGRMLERVNPACGTKIPPGFAIAFPKL